MSTLFGSTDNSRPSKYRFDVLPDESVKLPVRTAPNFLARSRSALAFFNASSAHIVSLARCPLVVFISSPSSCGFVAVIFARLPRLRYDRFSLKLVPRYGQNVQCCSSRLLVANRPVLGESCASTKVPTLRARLSLLDRISIWDAMCRCANRPTPRDSIDALGRNLPWRQ